MFIRILSLLLFLLPALPVHAQDTHKADSTRTKKERKIYLSGSVYDSFTRAPLKAKMTLMRPDSSTVDTASVNVWGQNAQYSFKAPRKTADYIVRARMEGYEDAFQNIHARVYARNILIFVPHIFMKRKADDVFRTDTLDGVVVTGTKIKMIQRGDTLVYDASAFKLPDGSMLDALIRQLPGAELKSNGDIYINGRKLDYLTLNGTDFFKGKNKVMLDNLPYFTVKNLKVYNKQTERSLAAGRDVEKRDYVMDVQLKREYNRGYMGNVEVGGGTQSRYMSRIFGLYYDDRTRVSAYANMNNVNEYRQPGQDGDWSPSNMPEGLTTTRTAGVNVNTGNKAKTVYNYFSANARWTDADNESRSASQRFASSGDIFSRNQVTSRTKNAQLALSNYFRYYNTETKKSFYNKFNLSHYSGDDRRATRSATFRREPVGSVTAVLDSAFNSSMADLINHSFNYAWRRYSSTNLTTTMNYQSRLPWGDQLTFTFNGSVSRTKPSDRLQRTGTFYQQDAASDLRNIYEDSRTNGFTYDLTARYDVILTEHIIPGVEVSYQNEYNKNRGLNYRLEQLQGEYMPTGNYDFNRKLKSYLPSTRDSLLLAFDALNSSAYTRHHYTYKAVPYLMLQKESEFFQATLSFKRVSERLDYHGGGVDSVATRGYTIVEPYIAYSNWQTNTNIYYNMSIAMPDMVSLMPVRNDLNPLVKRINNPHLKRTTSHEFSASHDFKMPRSGTLSVLANYTLTHNAIGNRTTYNTATGAYTYEQDNVKENNWNAGGTVTLTLPVDSARLWTLYAQLKENYQRSVDFDIAYDEASTALSRVNNFNTGASLKMTYAKGDWTLSAGANATWQAANGDRENFQTINAWNFDYGMNITAPLPGKFTLATDLRMFSRRGYQESQMNTNDLVWNAQLSRSFLKGKVTASLQAFDILHQLSSTQYSINAQGRTETWQNCIPRYAMLHLTYKFSMAPKGRK